MNLGYDQVVALPAMQADGKGGQDEIFKETNKVPSEGKKSVFFLPFVTLQKGLLYGIMYFFSFSRLPFFLGSKWRNQSVSLKGARSFFWGLAHFFWLKSEARQLLAALRGLSCCPVFCFLGDFY